MGVRQRDMFGRDSEHGGEREFNITTLRQRTAALYTFFFPPKNYKYPPSPSTFPPKFSRHFLIMSLVKKRSYAAAFGPVVARAAGNALGSYARKRIKRAYTSRTSRRRRVHDGPAVTHQFDHAVTYRKRRMPRRRRRRWVRFVRKVQSIGSNALGTITVTRNNQRSAIALQNTQAVVGTLMYTCKGVSPGDDDLDAMFISQGSVANSFDKYYFKSAVLDVLLCASSENVTVSIVCVYEIVSRNDIPRTSGTSVADNWINAIASVPNNGAYGPITNATYGITPFQVPSFCSDWLVYKSREIFISPGNVITLQMRDPRNRFIDSQNDRDVGLWTKRGLTRGYMFIVYGAPRTLGELAAPTEVTINFTRNYNYTVDNSNQAHANIV